jgi:hypothetical protein
MRAVPIASPEVGKAWSSLVACGHVTSGAVRDCQPGGADDIRHGDRSGQGRLR